MHSHSNAESHQRLTVSVSPVPAALMLRMATLTSVLFWNLSTSPLRVSGGVPPSILMNFTFFLHHRTLFHSMHTATTYHATVADNADQKVLRDM